MYCHLQYVNKHFVINDELLREKSIQESGPFLIPLVVVLIGTATSAISNPPRTTTRGIRNGTGLEFPL